MFRIDLNCDMGEGAGNDAAIMPFVTSANIACGAHAGDDDTMRATLRLALEHGVAAGAHPGYPDREGFGRQRMDMTPLEVRAGVADQISVLRGHAREVGIALRHVKPHGALYNAAALDRDVARAIVDAVLEVDSELAVYGLAGSVLIAEAERAGLRAINEVFADRSYESDGALTSRDVPGAVIDDPVAAAERAVHMVTTGRVQCRTGEDLIVNAQTICVHGDSPHALAIVRQVRRAFDDAAVAVTAP